jgi:multimeric flavodoxin WrbA
MKITAICGSPREGATLAIIENILNIINSNAPEIETELIMPARRNIRFCDGEQGCQKGECIIEDEMKDIIDIMKESDGFIFGSPTYFDNVTAIMKNFMDRTSPMTKDMELKGKFAALVATGDLDMNSIQKTIDNLRSFINAHEIKEVGYLAALSNSTGNEVVLNEMAKIAEQLVIAARKNSQGE